MIKRLYTIKPLSKSKRLGLIVIPVAVFLVTTVGILLNRPRGSLSHIFLYLLVVTVAASWWGMSLAFYAFLLSILAILYFFVPPLGSFGFEFDSNNYTSELVGLSVFLILTIFIVYLIAALQRERDRARAFAENERKAKETILNTSLALERQRRRSEFLQRSRQLLGDTIEPESILGKVLEELTIVEGGWAFVLLEDINEVATLPRLWKVGIQSENIQQLLSSADLIIPLRVSGQSLGQLGYFFSKVLEHETLQQEKGAINATLQALAEYVALSLENSKLYHTLEFQTNEIAQLLRNNLSTDTALSKRAEQLSVFYRLSAAIISGVNTAPLMTLGLGEASRVLSCSMGAVLLLNKTKTKLQLVARRGLLTLEESSLVEPAQTLLGEILKDAQSKIINLTQSSMINCPVLAGSSGKLRSALYAPILSEGEQYGLIIIASDKEGQYLQEECDFLTGLAGLLALALASTQLSQEREKAASMEERNRIARDLHDGLAQSINYIGLKTQLIQELYEAGETQKILEEVARIGRVAEMARLDVREALYGLRHSSQDRSLQEALTDLVHNSAALSGIKITLDIKPLEGWPILSISEQIQLLRIIQEALSNIQKHSKARSAELVAYYKPEERQISLVVSDNGVGFKLEEVYSSGGQHLGLGIMKERAARLPAVLEITSKPDSGTEIALSYQLI